MNRFGLIFCLMMLCAAVPAQTTSLNLTWDPDPSVDVTDQSFIVYGSTNAVDWQTLATVAGTNYCTVDFTHAAWQVKVTATQISDPSAIESDFSAVLPLFLADVPHYFPFLK